MTGGRSGRQDPATAGSLGWARAKCHLARLLTHVYGRVADSKRAGATLGASNSVSALGIHVILGTLLNLCASVSP